MTGTPGRQEKFIAARNQLHNAYYAGAFTEVDEEGQAAVRRAMMALARAAEITDD